MKKVNVERKPYIFPNTQLEMPKVFNLYQRRLLSGCSSSLMDISNLDFYSLALKKISLFGQEYLIYPNINLQCRMTKRCKSSCDFCIERICGPNYPEATLEFLIGRISEVFSEFHANEIFPSCTVTGGDPTIDIPRLRAVLEALKDSGVTKYNLNTSGMDIDSDLGDFLQQNGLPYLNISMHHWDGVKNQEIFRNPNAFDMTELARIMKIVGGGKYGNAPRIRLQCVLLNGYVDSIEKMEEYIQRAADMGIDNVAFRGLSVISRHEYTDGVVPTEDILDNMAASQRKGWKFICQNISDWYIYEDWMYNGVDVHLNFSDMELLAMYETRERNGGTQYGREFVIYEDGGFAGSWNRQMSEILPGCGK